MWRMAFIVGDSFVARGLGLRLFPSAGQLDHGLRVGDALELRRPDGSAHRASVMRLNPVHANPTPFWALVFPEWLPVDAPIGTEVWVADAKPGAAPNPAA
ncbi:hypothetical protein FTUN_7908 [Frigoriglobus tundricola]|uniref:Uncharacterized protein n=1 Tax=Frigoriglobus tundricola TaxID=2774151 RepID=A0A6M5Z4X8_9BACT|nr:hypothetical protein FTUN_7908 [Frigoriglobus tundricola]